MNLEMRYKWQVNTNTFLALFHLFWCILGGDSDLKAQEPQDLRPLHVSHGLHECKECDQVFPDIQR